MPSSNEDRPGRTEGHRAAPKPRGLAGHVHSVSSTRHEPKGKGIALVVLGVGVIVAIVLQILLPTGTGEEMRKQIEEDRRKLPAAGTEGEATPADEPAPAAPAAAQPGPRPRRPEIVVYDGSTSDPDWPIERPGASIPVPEGLGERTAGRLRLALSGLTEARLIADAGVRDLAHAVLEAPEAEEQILEDFVVGQLARLIPTQRLGVVALDASLLLAARDPKGLVPVVVAARRALEDDAKAPAALLFLDHVREPDRTASGNAAFAVAMDANRALYVRVLAARMAARWGAISEERAELEDDPDLPLAVRLGLLGE